MKHFSERNPSVIAVFGTIGLVLIFLVVIFSDRLPVIGRGTTYQAVFAESGGLEVGNEVRVAGVKVGKVTDVELDGAAVVVSFSVEDAWVGDRTTAAIKLRTLLGQKYLALDPQGSEELDADTAIPMSRTTVPFEMTEALEGLGSRLGKIDVPQLQESFQVLTDAFDGTPRNVRKLLVGLSALATTISDRDDELADLMASARSVTGDVADMNDQIASILSNGDLLLEELDNRREAIHQLFVGTRDFAREVSGLVEDNTDRLAPALDELDEVTAILRRNRKHIDTAMVYLATYYTTLTDATGTGPWLDGYICGLFDGTRPELDPDVRRDCDPGGGR